MTSVGSLEINGELSAEEIAALVVVLAGSAPRAAEAKRAPLGLWAVHGRRPPLHPGYGASGWVAHARIGGRAAR